MSELCCCCFCCCYCCYCWWWWWWWWWWVHGRGSDEGFHYSKLKQLPLLLLMMNKTSSSTNLILLCNVRHTIKCAGKPTSVIQLNKTKITFKVICCVCLLWVRFPHVNLNATEAHSPLNNFFTPAISSIYSIFFRFCQRTEESRTERLPLLNLITMYL